MKKHEHHKDNSHKLALALSLCLHALLLWGAYCLPIRPWTNSSSEYSVALYPTWIRPQKASGNLPDNPLVAPQLASEQAHDKSEKFVKIVEVIEDQETPPEDIAPASQEMSRQDALVAQVEHLSQNPPEVDIPASPQDEATMTIDQRSLYKAHQDEQVGPLLELAGWLWDMVPQPEDPTEESGKIVFQIKIDDSGEVIAVETIEKTISPLVEGIYQESLMGLTFSKTTDNLVYAPTSTGKVTFVLEVK